MKKILAFAVFVCALSFPSVAHAACSTYSYIGIYDSGGWVNFNDNTRAQQLISSGQASNILSIDENGNGFLFTTDTYFACTKPVLTVQSSGSRGLFIPGRYNHLGTQSITNKWLDLANKLNSWMDSNPVVAPTTTTTSTTTTIPAVTITTTTTTIPSTTTTSTTTTIPSTTTTVRPTTTTSTTTAVPPTTVLLTTTTVRPTTTTSTTTTIPPATTTITNPPIASYSKPLSSPSMAPYSIMAQFPVPSNLSLLQLSMQPGCCYSERIVCIDDKNKEHSWDSVNYPDNSKRYYDIVGIYDIYTTFSIKCLNSNSAGNSSWSPWYTYYGKTRPPVQPPVVQFPVISAPTATLPNVQAPIVPAKPQWKYVTKKVLQTIYSDVRTGAICRSGKTSTATRNGACSHHGGVAKWLTLPPKKVYVNKKYKCYLNQTTNQYTRNCVAV